MLQRGKYISREFQEYCAELALGRMSKPSSAPCDTRLFHRPSSGSFVRREMTVQTDLTSRPKTAPLRSPKQFPPASVEAPVNTSGFTSKSENAVVMDTEIFLPNALASEKIVQTRIEVPKMRKEKTFITKPSNQFSKLPGHMPREKCFIQSPRRKGTKPSKQFVNKLEKETIHSVDEYSESEEAAEQGYRWKSQNKKVESDNKSKDNIEGESNSQTADKKAENKADVATASRENKYGRTGTRSDHQQRYGNIKSSHSYNRKDIASKPTTKDTAFSILQKLTGKRQQDVNKPGQVPNVNKPKRKYKFSTLPTGNDDNSNHIAKNIPAQRKQMRDEKVNTRNTLTTETGFDTEQRHRKPLSAGVKNTQLTKKTAGKFPVYETKNPVCKPKQVVVRESQNANPQEKHTKSHSDVQSKLVSQKGKSSKESESMGIKIATLESIAQSSSTSSFNTKQKSVNENPVPRSSEATCGQKKSVKIQNAMISTSNEVSGPNETVRVESDDGRASVIRSNTPANLHPMLEDSPYVRVNHLLQSGNQRRRPGAASAHSDTRSIEQGCSSKISDSRNIEKKHCKRDFSYIQSVII